MEAFRAAAAEFDEVVLLDWDVSSLRPIDGRYVFDRLRLKSPFPPVAHAAGSPTITVLQDSPDSRDSRSPLPPR